MSISDRLYPGRIVVVINPDHQDYARLGVVRSLPTDGIHTRGIEVEIESKETANRLHINTTRMFLADELEGIDRLVEHPFIEVPREQPHRNHSGRFAPKINVGDVVIFHHKNEFVYGQLGEVKEVEDLEARIVTEAGDDDGGWIEEDYLEVIDHLPADEEKPVQEILSCGDGRLPWPHNATRDMLRPHEVDCGPYLIQNQLVKIVFELRGEEKLILKCHECGHVLREQKLEFPSEALGGKTPTEYEKEHSRMCNDPTPCAECVNGVDCQMIKR